MAACCTSECPGLGGICPGAFSLGTELFHASWLHSWGCSSQLREGQAWSMVRTGQGLVVGQGRRSWDRGGPRGGQGRGGGEEARAALGRPESTEETWAGATAGAGAGQPWVRIPGRGLDLGLGSGMEESCPVGLRARWRGRSGVVPRHGVSRAGGSGHVAVPVRGALGGTSVSVAVPGEKAYGKGRGLPHRPPQEQRDPRY